VWERSDPEHRTLRVNDAPYEFYVEDEEGAYESLYGHKLSKFKFKSYWEMRNVANELQSSGIQLFEYDIDPVHKLLSREYYGTTAPTPNITFFDIEVDDEPGRGFADFDNPYAPLNSVAIHHYWNNRTVLYAVPPKNWGPSNTWEEQLDTSLLKISEINLVET